VQFQIGAVLRHSNTRSLRVAGFEDEDDDEDENEAPHEGDRSVIRTPRGGKAAVDSLQILGLTLGPGHTKSCSGAASGRISIGRYTQG
jgi:hypothetical protein